MSDIGGLDTVEETTEEKVVEMTEKRSVSLSITGQ